MMEHQNNDDQGNHFTAASPVSLGAMLREARERLNFSIADVAVQIKFAPRQIEALEADDFKHLPEAAFLRGFVRSYAKILNLDAQPLLASLPQENAASAELVPPSVEVPYPVDNVSQIQTLILLGAALLLAVAAVGFSVWHYTVPPRQSADIKVETSVPLQVEKQTIPEPLVQEHNTPASTIHSVTKRESSSTAEQTSIQPEKTRAITSIMQPSAAAAQSSVRAAKTKTAAAAAQSSVRAAKTKTAATAAQSSVRAAKTKTAATAAQSSVRAAKTKAAQAVSNDSGNMDDTETPNIMLRLVFDEESWAEITDKDGNLISSQINPRGSELNVKGRLPMSLVIGHGATTHLYKNGEPVDLTRYTNATSEVARVTLE
jgi:cytoskeleton protein RodZ